MFKEISPEFLAQIATDSDRIPTLYYSRRRLVRKFFWMRLRLIYGHLARSGRTDRTCMDFGGGGGVFLPTLAGHFKSVVCIDLENVESRKVVERCRLDNVRLIQADIASADLGGEKFDVIVAADVLEHFKDLSLPVLALKRWLKPDGLLYTSLPTENWIYHILRKVFHVTKPWDHYHAGHEVESYLERQGFRRVYGKYVPFYVNLFPLFLITAWKHEDHV